MNSQGGSVTQRQRILYKKQQVKKQQAKKQQAKKQQAKKQQAKKRRRNAALLLSGIGAAALLVLYFAGASHFKNHFLSGSEMNGVDIGGLTLEEAETKAEAANQDYKLSVEGTNGVTETVAGSSIGLHYADDEEIAQLLGSQNRWAWFAGIGTTKTYAMSKETVYDSTLLDGVLDGLSSLDASTQTAPTDAYLTKDADGKYVIVPETAGTLIDVSEAKAKIAAAINEGKSEADLSSCLVQPAVTQNDAGLISRRDAWNAYMASAGLTYSFGENEETITSDVLSGLLKDDGTNVYLSDSAVDKLVNSWGKKYDTFGLSMQFKTHSGSTVTVPAGGDYGWALNVDKTADDVISAIEDGGSGTRNPIFEYSAKSWENGGLGGTYVEVSIEDQKLWCYKDGVAVMETDVVTGLPTDDRSTYKGVFAVDAKEQNATLGSYDVQGYESPVSYWAPFNGGEGLHDAPWRSEFGGTIYETNGSHGCVNIPPENMAVIYNTISIGTAVVVY